MTRRRFTLRSSHLLMWSSPLLLLVLVFTLNSRPLHRSPASTTSTTRSTTTAGPSSTTSITTSTTSTTTTAPPVATTRPPASTTTMSPTTTVPVTTTSRALTHSAATTTTSVATSEAGGRRNYAGWLTLVSPAALVPLRGPGQWALHATHAVISTLQCGSRSVALTSTVWITGTQTCNLDITINTGAPTQWTLRAAQ